MFLFAEDPRLAPTKTGTGMSEQLEIVVVRLNAGEQGAVVDLLALLEPGACFLLRRQLGDTGQNQEIARRILLKTAQSALDGQIQSAANLVQFVLSNIKVSVQHELGGSSACQRERPTEKGTASMTAAVDSLPALEREAITRFYGRGESVKSICAALKLSESRFFRIAAKVRKSVGKTAAPSSMAARVS